MEKRHAINILPTCTASKTFSGSSRKSLILQCEYIVTNRTDIHRIFFYIGTWTVLGGYSPKFVTDMAFRTLLHCIPESYSCEANVSGGFIISWFLENYKNTEKYWEGLASKIDPGSDGLITVPYWLGTLAPYWDPGSRGVTVGWSGIHILRISSIII